MGKLTAGAYRVIVETIDDKPELENFNALIWVNYDSAKQTTKVVSVATAGAKVNLTYGL